MSTSSSLKPRGKRPMEEYYGMEYIYVTSLPWYPLYLWYGGSTIKKNIILQSFVQSWLKIDTNKYISIKQLKKYFSMVQHLSIQKVASILESPALDDSYRSCVDQHRQQVCKRHIEKISTHSLWNGHRYVANYRYRTVTAR